MGTKPMSASFPTNEKYEFVQILPSIWPHSCAIDVMGIPAPNWVETGRLEVKSSLQSGRIMQAQVGAKPIDDIWLRRSHFFRLRVMSNWAVLLQGGAR